MPLICAMLCWEILDSAEITCNDTKEGEKQEQSVQSV